MKIFLGSHGFFRPRERAILLVGAGRLVSYFDGARGELLSFYRQPDAPPPRRKDKKEPMPKGHKVMSYAESQARCRAIFRGCPEIEPEVIEAVFKAHYEGWAMTRSEIAEARRWVQGLTYAPAGAKERYIVAWLSLHPELSRATLDQYTIVYFGEGTRQETFDRCRQVALEGPMLVGFARAIIDQVEQRVADKPRGFVLEEESRRD